MNMEVIIKIIKALIKIVPNKKLRKKYRKNIEEWYFKEKINLLKKGKNKKIGYVTTNS